jgi:glycosyltransferase involved in cell wall biosynthesis/anti-anti-sigma regulatory factor
MKNVLPHIVFVSPYPPSKVTLTEYGYHFIRAFRRSREVGKITVLCPFLPKGETYTAYAEKGIELVPCWRFNSVFAAFQIRRQVQNLDADAVVFNIQFMSFGEGKVPAALGLIAPWLCRRKGLPVITLLHNITETVKLENIGLSKGGLAATLMLKIGRVLTRFLLKSDLVGLTISQYVDIIRREYAVKHAVLLPHGSFDLPERVQLADNPECIHLLAFGKFGTYKKAEVLLDALPLLRKRHPGKAFRVTIAGTDNPNVKGYIAGLEQAWKADPDVVFTGYVPEEAVEALFKSATMVVFPYTATTGSSGILHQAGSYARACVLPHMDDLARVVEEEGYAGEFFETANPQSLADAVSRLIEDPEKRKTIEEINYKAAAALSMDDLVHWYLAHFEVLKGIRSATNLSFMGSNPPEVFEPIGLPMATGPRSLQIGYAHWADRKGKESWHVLRLAGAFKAGALPDLQLLISKLTGPATRGVYLDLRSVESSDLLGLNELVRLHRYLQLNEQSLRLLCREDSELYQWLRQSGLAAFLELARISTVPEPEAFSESLQQGNQQERIHSGPEQAKNIVPDKTGGRQNSGADQPYNSPR